MCPFLFGLCLCLVVPWTVMTPPLATRYVKRIFVISWEPARMETIHMTFPTHPVDLPWEDPSPSHISHGMSWLSGFSSSPGPGITSQLAAALLCQVSDLAWGLVWPGMAWEQPRVFGCPSWQRSALEELVLMAARSSCFQTLSSWNHQNLREFVVFSQRNSNFEHAEKDCTVKVSMFASQCFQGVQGPPQDPQASPEFGNTISNMKPCPVSNTNHWTCLTWKMCRCDSRFKVLLPYTLGYVGPSTMKMHPRYTRSKPTVQFNVQIWGAT